MTLLFIMDYYVVYVAGPVKHLDTSRENHNSILSPCPPNRRNFKLLDHPLALDAA